jgi:hypothetical protein
MPSQTPSAPAIRFKSRFDKYISDHGKRTIKSLHISNVSLLEERACPRFQKLIHFPAQVVLHASMKQTPRTKTLHKILGKVLPSAPIDNVQLNAVTEKIKAPFSQNRVFTSDHGSISLFNTGNVIRAAKGHPARAVAAIGLFVRWLYHTTDGDCPPWYTAVSAPNAVATGLFKDVVSENLKTSWTTTKTSKFPGMAITLPTPGVTPEVFDQNDLPAKFILPGFKGPSELAIAADELSKLQSGASRNSNIA